MKKIHRNTKVITTTVLLTAALIFAGVSLPSSPENTGAAEKVTEITHGEAAVQSELIAKRTKFTKQFLLSDGSFLANSYSMPIHYKKGGQWKEINTTLVNKNKKAYKTKSTSLGITVAKKANTKAEITWKRGKSKLSIALQAKRVKARKATITNSKKQEKTDILNSNEVRYKKAYKNQTLIYEIYPEKLVEKLAVMKKASAKKITLNINSGKLKVKVKNNRIYFQTKKGTTRYKRLKTIITDRKGVSTSKVKVKYNKKKKTITMTPDKTWLSSKKRAYPLTIRTAYVTDQHERDVKVGAAYAGVPKANYAYNEDLLIQANKCIAFTQMSDLAELSRPDIKIRDARLYVKNEGTLNLGAGRTFDIGVYRVTSKWTGKKVTNNKRPTYETERAANLTLQKKGIYTCDITNVVKEWAQGVPNNGVALVADNADGIHQAKIEKNPFFSVHYEIVGFDGAVELKENQDITRDVLKSGQENYFYFDIKPGIAYDLYTNSQLDTQGILYDTDKERLAYDDNSGFGKNFQFTRSYNGRHYLKINVKGKETGAYTLSLKKRFAIPVVTGTKGQDSYILKWDPVQNAKEYLITVYDANGKRHEILTEATTYEYAYDNETIGRTLAFTVTPRENKNVTGESSEKIYNAATSSAWCYGIPMQQKRADFGSAVWGEKIYVLGGWEKDAHTWYKDVVCYDPQKKTWTKVSEYPEAIAGIRHAAVVPAGDCLYIIGGQSGTDNDVRLLKTVYAYYPGANRWIRLADLPQGRMDMPVVAYDGKIILFARAGTTERIDVYDPATNQWTSKAEPDTSTIIQAQVVDDRILVLREKADPESIEQKAVWEEYLPESNEYDTIGKVISLVNANQYQSGAVINGTIYLVNNKKTNRVLCYDVYQDQWSELSRLNIEKETSQIQSVDGTLYNIGGYAAGFGTLDVVESLSIERDVIRSVLDAKKGTIYEMQVNAGNSKEETDYFITLRMDPTVLQYVNTSSFMQDQELKSGKEGVKLVSYSAEKGVMVLKYRGKMEAGDTFETVQSVPLQAVRDKKTTVEMQVEKKEGGE